MFRNPVVDAVVVILIVLLFFGPKRLPELGKSLGSGFREFKDGISRGSDESDSERPELARASDEAGTGVPPTGAGASQGGPGGQTGAGAHAGTDASQVGAERRP